MDIPYIDERRVAELIDMADLIEAMEAALADFSAGRVMQPVRMALQIEPEGGYLGVMPAVSEAMGVKLVTFYPDNAAAGLETHMAVIALFRRSTGEPLVLMDGRLITEMRTAAVSAVATRWLAPDDAHSLAILGSGVQARSHFEALGHVMALEDVRVWSRTPEHAERLAADIGGRALPASDAVRGADVVVTATSASEPVLQGAWLEPGAHVNAVGACRPDWRELDDKVMAQTIVVDSREGAQSEAGDVILSGASITAELGEIVAGAKTVDRQETTVFKSLGMAVEDLASAQLVYGRLPG